MYEEKRKIHKTSWVRPALTGAAIALSLISLLLLSVDEPDPAWPKYWMARPLVVVPLAGAFGGIIYYLMDYLRYMGGWRKTVANIVSVLLYLFVLWIGTVLGLDGTLWN